MSLQILFIFLLGNVQTMLESDLKVYSHFDTFFNLFKGVNICFAQYLLALTHIFNIQVTRYY